MQFNNVTFQNFGPAGVAAGAIQVNTSIFNIPVSSPLPPVPIELLLVAGGGAGGHGGGTYGSGGGGAGGVIRNYSNLSTQVTYTITVGAGGTVTRFLNGGNGGNSIISGSSFSTLTAIGGGGGGGYDGSPTTGYGQNGGSGGGAGWYSAPTIKYGSGVPGQGNPGGAYFRPQTTFGGGGGGGSGQAGGSTSDTPTQIGFGGYGIISYISGANLYYAGGGGAQSGATNLIGKGGAGGGGSGSYNSPGPVWVNAANGIINTGGGGGGLNDTNSDSGGFGGSGVVILRHPNTYAIASVITGSPNVIYANGNIIYRFWQSGTIQW